MKKAILIILLSLSLTITAQEKEQKCVTVKVEQVENHKVKVTKIDSCERVVSIKVYLKKEWDAIQRKRKLRKNRK
tara:strand:- start:249 stop:473 length:225 start_codon:yes stop_codon:yes gene_type:complete